MRAKQMESFPIKIRWLIAFIIVSACVDRINFDVPPAELQIVIEGMISDAPGPYMVKVSRAFNLDADSTLHIPVEQATISLYDDEGNQEDLSETSPGIYVTAGILQGKIGHSYHITVETTDGNIFESRPDIIMPVGEIEDITYEFEKRTIQKSYGEVAADVFNVFVDAHAGSGEENYVRWRFRGTYKVLTFPEFNLTEVPPYTPYKNPYPCSGYIVVSGPGGTLVQESECTCCVCWVSESESVPQLSDVQFVSDNEFRNVKVAEVPINTETFYDKYLIEIDQMSLSKTSFEFFKMVRAQKEGAASLFQPPSGEIIGNISAKNSNDPVVGIFWATSIRSKSLYINRTDVPYLLTPVRYVTQPCDQAYPNATTEKPQHWE